MGGAGWGMMRSLRRDGAVTQQKLPPGLIRRIVEFAKPYRRKLSVFLVLIIVDAVVTASSPLIYRAIIDDGILKRNPSLIIKLAALVAVLAVADTALSLWQRWISARVGEGLIYDMRTRVFAHFQKMPIAFFTRTQTGALVSRLNNDVLDAQQAFTDTFSSVISNIISVGIILAAMLILSWQITLVALVLLPLFIVPARLIGKRVQSITREGYNLNARMTNTMTERFNVSGAMLVKLFGHSGDEIRGFESKAGRVRDIGTGYRGPGPIKGHGPHRYLFQLFALAQPITIVHHLESYSKMRPQHFFASIPAGTVLAQGQLTGIYER